MGRAKAAITQPGGGTSLARRTAAILAACTDPVVEVGPGHSGLPHVGEDPPGSGPLAAVAAGAAHLFATGWTGPVLVLATDLPMLEAPLVEWLVGHPDTRSVVPLVAGRAQTLCARYDRVALEQAVAIAANGSRSMRDLLSVADHLLAGPDDWGRAGIEERWFADADTPADLDALDLPRDLG